MVRQHIHIETAPWLNIMGPEQNDIYIAVSIAICILVNGDLCNLILIPLK